MMTHVHLCFRVCYAALPKPPTSLLVSAVTANSISLSWNAEPTGLQDPVISYVVQYRRKTLATDSRELSRDASDGFREMRDVTGVEYGVIGLEAFTQYELRVISVNSVGRSLPSRSVEATTSQLGNTTIVY